MVWLILVCKIEKNCEYYWVQVPDIKNESLNSFDTSKKNVFTFQEIT